jgi:hypothetical protein
MDLLFLVFLSLGCISLIISFCNLISVIKKKKITVNSAKEKAHYMVDLLHKGYVLRHILTNDAQKRDNKKFLESYCAFLNKANINGIKEIKGANVYESY